MTQKYYAMQAKHLTSAAIQPFSYLGLVIQNLTDIFLFSVVFNSSQITGVVIAALGPLLQIAVIVLERKR